jgi:hypothetical protein
MRKYFFLTCFILGASLFAAAQWLRPEVIASQGGVSKSENISLEWTLGEFAVESVLSGSRLFTQGFHQPLLITKEFYSAPDFKSAENKTDKTYTVKVFPNPATSLIQVNLEFQTEERIVLSMVDFRGAKVFSRHIHAASYSGNINVSGLAQGVYLLEIKKQDGQTVKTFKIIKM